MKLEWYWPYNTPKEARVAAYELMHDDRFDEMEVAESPDHDVWINGSEWDAERFQDAFLDIRPIHPHRWLAEVYEEGQIWECYPYIVRSIRIEKSMQGNDIPIVDTVQYEKWGVSVRYYDDNYEQVQEGILLKVNFGEPYKEYIKWRPSPEHEPELFKWYEENSLKGKV